MTNTNDIRGEEEIFGLSGRPNFSSFLYQEIKELTIREMYAVSDTNNTSRYCMAASDPQLIQTNQ
jgi:hypothetical protein